MERSTAEKLKNRKLPTVSLQAMKVFQLYLTFFINRHHILMKTSRVVLTLDKLTEFMQADDPQIVKPFLQIWELKNTKPDVDM